VFGWIAQCDQSRAGRIQVVDPMRDQGRDQYSAAADNCGNDRQEQSGGTEEDKTGDRVVMVVLAIGTYPNYESRHDGTGKKQRVHTPQLLIDVCAKGVQHILVALGGSDIIKIIHLTPRLGTD